MSNSSKSSSRILVAAALGFLGGLVVSHLLLQKSKKSEFSTHIMKINSPEARDYISKKANREVKALELIHKDTKKQFPIRCEMITDLPQLYLFKWLVKTLKVKKAIELGVLTGSSSCMIGLSLPEDGKLLCFDPSKEYTAIAKKYWKLLNISSKIELRNINAIEGLNDIISNHKNELNTYDFVYIDAVKEEYLEYYNLCLKLLKKGGVMAIDNVLQHWTVINSNSSRKRTIIMQKFNDFVMKDKRVNIAFTTIGDGVTFVTKL